MKGIWNRQFRLVLMFFIIALAGWIFETVSCAVQFGEFLDRGFLTLPFCPIYGFCLLAIYLLIGTPQKGGCLLARCKSRALRYVLYTVLAVLIPTAAELATGLTFEWVFGVRLWDYTWHQYDFMGYISLEMGLFWGVGVWVIMGLVFPGLEKLVARIPEKAGKTVTAVTLCAVLADMLICTVK